MRPSTQVGRRRANGPPPAPGVSAPAQHARYPSGSCVLRLVRPFGASTERTTMAKQDPDGVRSILRDRFDMTEEA